MVYRSSVQRLATPCGGKGIIHFNFNIEQTLRQVIKACLRVKYPT